MTPLQPALILSLTHLFPCWHSSFTVHAAAAAATTLLGRFSIFCRNGQLEQADLQAVTKDLANAVADVSQRDPHPKHNAWRCQLGLWP